MYDRVAQELSTYEQPPNPATTNLREAPLKREITMSPQFLDTRTL